eukprot:1252647-Rhodomonas_salina.3
MQRARASERERREREIQTHRQRDNRHRHDTTQGERARERSTHSHQPQPSSHRLFLPPSLASPPALSPTLSSNSPHVLDSGTLKLVSFCQGGGGR